jgi:DNA helicase HerA-like ATPase
MTDEISSAITDAPEDLDAWFPRAPDEPAQQLGMVIGGSLSKGLDVKLDRRAVIEGLAVGRYVVVHGQTGRRFFSIVTDVALDSTNPLIEKYPPAADAAFVRQVYAGTTTFGRLHVAPMLVLDPGETEPRPVKTIPAHFAPVYEASAEDVGLIFGDTDQEGYFQIGEPLEMDDIPVALNLARFAERASGVFGKTGTGKTFLTRLLLAGMIKHGKAVNLIFDMHNEYGWKSQTEERAEVKGLRQLFTGGQVSVFTLDQESSRRRGSKVDYTVRVGYEQIEPEDVEMVAALMGLSDVQIGALYFLRRLLGRSWIARLLDEDDPLEDLAPALERGLLHGGTLGAIQRKLGMFRRFGFLQRTVSDNPVTQILNYLDNGTSVILEFGRYGNSLEAYILVANYITRRIHQKYVERKEAALGGQADEPRQLVITIEEAHKFLDPGIAGQTIFGTIARELRKYNVTLLIVDQRPSGIDPEVMSQVGTRVTCLLDDEADIRAVLSGISGAGQLRQVLARLDTRQQALIMGHAVPMPLVIKTRSYDSDFYTAMGFREAEDHKAVLARGRTLLRGEDDGEGI